MNHTDIEAELRTGIGVARRQPGRGRRVQDLPTQVHIPSLHAKNGNRPRAAYAIWTSRRPPRNFEDFLLTGSSALA